MDEEVDEYLSLHEINLETKSWENMSRKDIDNISVQSFKTAQDRDLDNSMDIEPIYNPNEINSSMMEEGPRQSIPSNSVTQAFVNDKPPGLFDSEIFSSKNKFVFNARNYETQYKKSDIAYHTKISHETIDNLIIKKLAILRQEVKKLKFEYMSKNHEQKSRSIILCISGFLSEDECIHADWSEIKELYPENEVIRLNWQAFTKMGMVKEAGGQIANVVAPVGTAITKGIVEIVPGLNKWLNDKEEKPELDESFVGASVHQYTDMYESRIFDNDDDFNINTKRKNPPQNTGDVDDLDTITNQSLLVYNTDMAQIEKNDSV